MLFRVNNQCQSYTVEADTLIEAAEKVQPQYEAGMKRGWTSQVISKPRSKEWPFPRAYVQIKNSRGRLITGCVVYRERASDHGEMITAQPYQARWCATCKVWIFTDRAPFAEGDRTKTLRDYLHWEREHATPEELTGKSVGYPFMTYNSRPVQAVLESIKRR